MRIFTDKSIWKKIVIALLLVLAFQTIMVKPVQADVVEFGGKLMGPILSLLTSLGDGINDIIARSIMGANTTLYRIENGSDFWEGFLTVVVAIAAAALTIALIVATGGLAAVAAAAVGITATVSIGAGTIIAGLGAGLLSAVWFNDQVLPEDIYLPMYTYSAEEIFKGNILLFDVNFFGNEKEIYAKLSDGASLKVSDYAGDDKLQEEVNKHFVEVEVTEGSKADESRKNKGKCKNRILLFFRRW
jgi:hypothetical protein